MIAGAGWWLPSRRFVYAQPDTASAADEFLCPVVYRA
jgi:hypothetical protein